MKRIRLRLFICEARLVAFFLSFAFCVVASSPGQQRPPSADVAQQPQATPSLSLKNPVLVSRPRMAPVSAEGRIHLDVMVTDAGGSPVSGLQPQDFTLLDDNHRQKILSFQSFDGVTARPDPPVEVVLVIDTVNNGFVELGYIREGVESFLRQNNGHLAQPVSIIVLTIDGFQAQKQPSTDGNALASMVHQIKPSIRHTGVYTFPISILSLAHFAQEETGIPGRKLIVWPGPGWPVPAPIRDTFTEQDERDRRAHFDLIVRLSTALREARIALYGGYARADFYARDYLKGVKKVSDVDGRNLSMEVLALQSGGRGELSYMNKDSDLQDQLNHFVSEANNFYTLSFNPPAAHRADEYHDLKVVIDKPGLTARTNTGYYDQPEYFQPEQAPMAPSVADEKEIVPAFVRWRISVGQLAQVLKDDRGKSDSDVARQLSGMELTERLSSTGFVDLQSCLPGRRSREALVALFDASSFLALPADEIPAFAAPNFDEQRRIVALAVDDLGNTLKKLPNFYATRTTVRYDDTVERQDQAATTSGPFRVVGNSSATVLYRDGTEVANPLSTKARKADTEEKGLQTRGTFGPILSTVIVDAAHSVMTFSHWEQGADGRIAVFRYAVPKEKSHYEVAYRSFQGEDQSLDFQQRSGYHGEVAIDATNGSILSLTVEADLDPGLPIVLADIMVEYGAVDIGGKTYRCPVRSVSLSTARRIVVTRDRITTSTSYGANIRRLNDVTFGQYHVFRSEMRILPAYEPKTDEK
jgi:VWFA-related protein